MTDKPKPKLKKSEDYYIRQVLQTTPVGDIMTHPVRSVRIDEPFSHVAELVVQGGLRHVPIVNEKMRLVGLFTQRDLYKLQSPHRGDNGLLYYDPAELNLYNTADVMIKAVFTVKADNTVADVIPSMVHHKYGCVPVVDQEDRLVGIVTQHDILKMALAILEESSGK